MKNISTKYLSKTLTILLVFISINTFSQYKLDWEQNFGGSALDATTDIIQTSDGGYIHTGRTFSNDFSVPVSYGSTDSWVIKTNSFGNMIWQKNYGGTNSDIFASVLETDDGGFIFFGGSSSNDFDVANNNGAVDYWLVKTDALGNILWENTYGGNDNEYAQSIIKTFDGGYILLGSTESSNTGDVSANNGDSDFWIVKTDSLGNLIWENTYGGSDTDTPHDIIQASDSNYVISGESRSSNGDVSGNYGNVDAWIIKIDQSGNILWENNYGTFGSDNAQSIKETSAGYTFAGGGVNNGGIDYWVVSLDFVGNINWENNYGGTAHEEANSIHQNANGDYVILGSTFSNDGDVGTNYGDQDIWMIKTDSLGNLLWEKNFGGSDADNVVLVNPTAGNGFIIGGYSESNDYDVQGNNGYWDCWIVKIHPLLADVYGTVYLESNNNCIYDSGDTTFSNILVSAHNSTTNNTYYDNTNSLGKFQIDLDTIDYKVSVSNFSPYWEISNCSQDTQTINLNSSNTSDTLDFFFKSTQLCPYLEVDISTPLLRRCFSNDYYISYCNNGSSTANNAYVEVEFDSTLVINSSSIPWTTVNGNIYTFPIGNIDMFDCGSFSVNVSIPCDSTTFLGQVLCTEANIFPNTLCLPSSSTWNGAELEASAECIGQDSVMFTLKNIGTGNMSSDVPIIGIEDVILIMDTDEILNAGEEVKWTFPTNGTTTHRIIAQQPIDHPFKTFTTDAVAHCDLIASAGPPPVSDSAFLAYPNDEESPFEAVDCQPIIGSYDPNDKTVYPSGVSSSHYISETTDLEYKIRFQNTGTDTAFTVVIRDSISSLLDLNTFTAGASSHSYSYNIYGTGVVDFTFNNILLPDSFVNEPASHGFVQYKIEQKSTNQTGDIIYNNADIFFDYNLPVRTNTTFNEIGGIILDTLIYKFPNEEIPDGIKDLQNFNLKTYPNPAEEYMVFEFEESMKSISIELYNLEGKMQQKTVGVNSNSLKIQRANLASGMYIFKIYSAGNEIAFGKLIFK